MPWPFLGATRASYSPRLCLVHSDRVGWVVSRSVIDACSARKQSLARWTSDCCCCCAHLSLQIIFFPVSRWRSMDAVKRRAPPRCGREWGRAISGGGATGKKRRAVWRLARVGA
ncbi:hypothetical protein BKA81DRAFT_47414 [Phyllosticta paracitricarpa]